MTDVDTQIAVNAISELLRDFKIFLGSILSVFYKGLSENQGRVSRERQFSVLNLLVC